jgi:hypothetical protein
MSSHLKFNAHAARVQAPPPDFDPGANVSFDPMSALWMVLAVMAVAGATFAIVWFA